MAFLRHPVFTSLAAFWALLIFTGDLVADARCDASGQCVAVDASSNAEHSEDACPSCACAVHSGAVVIANISVFVSPTVWEPLDFSQADETATAAEPAAIDHPPQLA